MGGRVKYATQSECFQQDLRFLSNDPNFQDLVPRLPLPDGPESLPSSTIKNNQSKRRVPPSRPNTASTFLGTQTEQHTQASVINTPKN